MKYLLLIYGEEGHLSESEMQACYVESSRICEDLEKKGKFLGASPLQSVSLATSVRVREGRRLVTDGPFAETREQLGGYFLVEAADLDEAIEIAGTIPGARWGTVEIRPVVEQPGLPKK
ncbi:MAG: YciI family protein [Vulcanimicrobiota bacterium]